MSWILQNKFVAGLIACTVVLSGVLLYFGTKASGRYQESMEAFQGASAQVSTYERLTLYPSQENLDGKTKALADYDQAINDLAGEFAKFQREPTPRISPQEFGNRLVATNERISSRFAQANVALPAGFYSGFETYTGALAQSGATAVLNHQLEVTDAIFQDLAEARPVALINFRRAPQPEETGATYEPNEGDIVRPHSFELTFQGTEASARRFVTSMVDASKRFVVIRSLRIINESTSAPKSSSAQFTAPAAPAGGAPANPFGGGFDAFFNNVEADEAENEGENEAEDADGIGEAFAPPAPPQPAGTRRDASRMLGQVAGSELIRVFIRFDVMEFLPQSSANSSDES